MLVSEKVVKAGLLVAGAGLLVIAARVIGEKRLVAEVTTQQIEDAIAALDPATRAAVLTRLTADAAQKVKNRFEG